MKSALKALPVLFILTFVGCGIDIGSGSQLVGQQCFQESDCAEGLVCFERTCRPQVGSASGRVDRDMGSANNQNNNSGNNEVDGGTPVNNSANNLVDAGREVCELGARRCIERVAYQICVEVNGEAQFRRVDCDNGELCVEGECMFAPMCEDFDGDGYGLGCPLGDDCDDQNPERNPGLREDCSTPFDDNCNGQRNEGCDDDCCAGGCGPNQFCDVFCMCSDYNADICQFQNQPCNEEGQFVNGFYCVSLSGSSTPRCYGVCDINAPDPDSTCPGDNSVCAFGAGDGDNGICLSSCDAGPNGQRSGCGEPDQGCLALGDDGVCAPINDDNGEGSPCDPDEFFDCDAGLVCVNLGGGFRGRCREGCRPFEYDGTQTDCSDGHCVAFSPGFGICSPSNNSTEGDSCNPPFTTCNDDAVACYPDPQGQGNSCLRVCRIDEGNDDCASGGDCTQFDMNQPDVGICF